MWSALTQPRGWKNKLARTLMLPPSDFRVATFRDGGISSRMPHLLDFRMADETLGGSGMAHRRRSLIRQVDTAVTPDR